MLIYLAGKVPKGDNDKNFVPWRKQYTKILQSMYDVKTIDPYAQHLDESDAMHVVGKDCMHIKKSDAIIVNAEMKLGVGTSQEMVIAKYFNKPVITVLPKQSHHRKKDVVFFGKNIEDWVHPFIDVFSDVVVESVHDIDLKNIPKPKSLSIIDRSIAYALKQ